jgi:2-hydroxyglutarate dehydrogenase
LKSNRGFFISETTPIRFAIVGSGIIGFQVAYQLLKRGIPSEDIAVFEENIYPGEHSTARNSGVLHAGLYYPADSKKQKFCLEGNRLWDEQAHELGIQVNRCGKYIVATNDSETEQIEELYEFATQKGVPGLTWNEASEIKDYVNVKKAFFSKSTGVVSVSEVIKKFQDYLYQKDVPLLLGQKVENLNKDLEFTVGDDRFKADVLINCGGLKGVELRSQLGLADLENNWVKGRYLKLNKKYYNQSLIYPLPEKGLKGLGVHTSFDLDGIVRFGPDTFDVNAIDYKVEEDALEAMWQAIQKTFKGIEKSDLSLDYAGIRAKIKGHDDFIIQSPLSGYFECLGIESPGLTSSPAIASYLIENII